MNERTVHALGVWALRVALVAGIIVGGCLGKETVAGTCFFGLMASFLFL